jgi:hypothetical protein
MRFRRQLMQQITAGDTVAYAVMASGETVLPMNGVRCNRVTGTNREKYGNG